MRFIVTVLSCFFGIMALLMTASQRGSELKTIRDEIADIQKQITHESQQLSILRADWDILNRPESLRRLIRVHRLDLQPLEGMQILDSVSELPINPHYVPVELPTRRLRIMPSAPDALDTEIARAIEAPVGATLPQAADLSDAPSLVDILRDKVFGDDDARTSQQDTDSEGSLFGDGLFGPDSEEGGVSEAKSSPVQGDSERVTQ